MTFEEIEKQVNGWNMNLSIFEIYDEVKDMGKFGYGGSQTEDLSRLLTHAYYFFNEHKYPKVIIEGVNRSAGSPIAELAEFLGAKIMSQEEAEELEKELKKEFDVKLWRV